MHETPEKSATEPDQAAVEAAIEVAPIAEQPAENIAEYADLAEESAAAPADVSQAEPSVAADEPAAELPPPAPAPSTWQQLRAVLPILADPADIPLFFPGKNDRLIRWLAIGAVFVLYLMNAGSFGLWDPWETHYGEVSRNMVETYDWVNPWWGYHNQIGSEPVSGEWFYSKPIYIFWAEVSFIKLIGYSDWALRLPQALLGASMCSMVYLTIERVLSRNKALFALAVAALSPFVYMVSRQAQTDMPFVATMTIGLLFFAMAFLSRRQALTQRGFVYATGAFVLFMLLNLVPQFLIISTDLFQADPDGHMPLADLIEQNGVYHLIVYIPVTIAILSSVLLPIWRERKANGLWSDAFIDRQLRRFFLLCGYMMLAQATYAKGLLGFMLPGAVLLVYFAATRQWKLFGKLELLRGTPLFFVTVSPWYVAMFCRHGLPYYQRFFIHDHFNRVGAGVHQIDTGTFEYFVKWLGYGLFPWSAFVPLALVAAAGYTRADVARTDAAPARPRASADFESDLTGHVRALMFAWFIVSFIVFTLSSTRFHHYILPGVPALAVLVGLYLSDLRLDKSIAGRVAVVLSMALFGMLLLNLMGDYQNLRNLFTYKYDRPLPENLPTDWNALVHWNSDPNPLLTWGQSPFGKHVGPMVANVLSIQWFRFDSFWPVAGSLGGLALILMLVQRARTFGLWLLTSSALLIAFWTLNYYMPTLAPHWSQKYLFEAYYGDCQLHPNPPSVQEAYTPLVSKIGLSSVAEFFDARNKRVCNEDIVSWLITWRGETYYSNNEIRPLNKATQLEPYLKDMNHGKKFYSLLERGRTSGFASKLKSETKKLRDDGNAYYATIKDWNVELISNDSAYFALARCTPIVDDGTEPPTAKTPKPAAKPRGLPKAAAEPAEKEEGSSPNPSF